MWTWGIVKPCIIGRGFTAFMYIYIYTLSDDAGNPRQNKFMAHWRMIYLISIYIDVKSFLFSRTWVYFTLGRSRNFFPLLKKIVILAKKKNEFQKKMYLEFIFRVSEQSYNFFPHIFNYVIKRTRITNIFEAPPVDGVLN